MVLTSDIAAHAERLGKVSLRTLADSGETRSNRLLASAAGIEFGNNLENDHGSGKPGRT